VGQLWGNFKGTFGELWDKFEEAGWGRLPDTCCALNSFCCQRIHAKCHQAVCSVARTSSATFSQNWRGYVWEDASKSERPLTHAPGTHPFPRAALPRLVLYAKMCTELGSRESFSLRALCHMRLVRTRYRNMRSVGHVLYSSTIFSEGWPNIPKELAYLCAPIITNAVDTPGKLYSSKRDLLTFVKHP
jgi:hypothetical protein